MKKIIFLVVLLLAVAVSTSAAEIEIPEAPDQVQDLMPDEKATFSEGLRYILSVAVEHLAPDFRNAVRVCASVLATVIVLSFLDVYDGKNKDAVGFVGIIAISILLLDSTHSLIELGVDTVTTISEYGKVLIPVMATALAAQGGTGMAGVLCTSTVFFDAVLCDAISNILVPGIYIYLAVVIVNAIADDGLLKKMADFVKSAISWGLKITLYAFTGYIGITGIVAGTADQTALKAAKLTIGGFVPVVGSILSDASETILVSAAVVKNSVGIYGMITLIALIILPFLKIGLQYILMKSTAAICSVFSHKGINSVLNAFSDGMGLLLAMTSSICVLLMISVMCFLRGMG